ncbi:MAG: hypothetical protein SGARI_003192 [Bacillariaceae sp.]
MPRFFQQTKYKSFQRQCNLWGFDRIPNGPQKGGYVRDEHFSRGSPSLVGQIKRQKIKGELSKRRRRGAAAATAATTKATWTSRLSSCRTSAAKKRSSASKPMAVVSNDCIQDFSSSSYQVVHDTQSALQPLGMMMDDFGDLDALDIDLFVNSDDDEDMEVVFKNLDKDNGSSCETDNTSSEDAPIVYLDSCESGLPKQSSLIDWLVLEKKAAARRKSSSKDSMEAAAAAAAAVPVPDSPSDASAKELSPICALLRRNSGSSAAAASGLPRSVSPSSSTLPLAFR